MSQRVRVRAQVGGLVQGVGFRPFVHNLATGMGLGGQVGNDSTGAFVEVEGDPGRVEQFLARLRSEHPPLALIDQVTVTRLTPAGASRFEIAASRAAAGQRPLVSPDVATCPACLRELSDPTDRRYRHPFVNCTDCGPRFTIVVDLPYDRGNTTMAGFAMCAGCRREYTDPGNRRFHAQPVACPDCGPRLALLGPDGAPLPGDPVAAAAALLLAGETLAVKGIGGYHLAADATSEPAVATLRARKHRPAKPFAVMVPDLATAGQLCHLSNADEQLLTSAARPIVLLRRRARNRLASSVAPDGQELGLLLPYTPLHQLLLAEVARPLVMTSGNLSDEPIAYRENDAARLAGVAAAILHHDRPIQTPADDSVARTCRGRPLLLRRSRGHVPQPIPLPVTPPQPVLGCGAELKNTFCLTRGSDAFLSAHIGDLTGHAALQMYAAGIDHFRRLLGVEPELVAHDLHPDYQSTRYAMELTGVRLVGVQHHHAHIAACLVDNQHPGPVIGVAFDGLGYGPDGTLWGGELLVADLVSYRRAGQLAPVPMPGGTTAIRQPWRMAVAYLAAAVGEEPPAHLPLLRRYASQWDRLRQLTAAGLAPLTSSAGRLFDAVAAILDLGDRVSYEGQAAVALQQLADPAEPAEYQASVAPAADPGGPLQLSGADLVAAVVSDLRVGVPPRQIAARFHNGLAAAVTTACQRIRDREGLSIAALSGGVFQNPLLLERTADRLTAAGFEVLTHHQVPPNDGGISLGQAAIAAGLQQSGSA